MFSRVTTPSTAKLAVSTVQTMSSVAPVASGIVSRSMVSKAPLIINGKKVESQTDKWIECRNPVNSFPPLLPFFPLFFLPNLFFLLSVLFCPFFFLQIFAFQYLVALPSPLTPSSLS
eukprot:TRINITY_DN9898_c1_g1_i1.p1 TRINITY_DN9898_c1_g1~~TRINITY_DN9898_c1_g1_i1.p1  ORF type:complete len:117 (+),score=11.14 TRINITY_DN9898_c1_g1_i1:320-670(+)